MAMIQAKCENCGAVLSIDSDRMISFCSYCGSKYILDDSVNYNNTYTKVEHMYADVVQVNETAICTAIDQCSESAIANGQ